MIVPGDTYPCDRRAAAVRVSTMKTVAERVRWARGRRGYSCAGLDRIAGLSCGHSAKVERGDRDEPSAMTVAKLARALEIDPQWIMFGGTRPQIAKAE